MRDADDEGDWQAAGCSSSAQWLARISSSDYRTAAQIMRTSSALGSLPALDEALSAGVLTLDQVSAAARHATPKTDAQLALDNLILLCTRHHKLLHDHHIHTNGTAEQPLFSNAGRRAITTNQPHAPPR